MDVILSVSQWPVNYFAEIGHSRWFSASGESHKKDSRYRYGTGSE